MKTSTSAARPWCVLPRKTGNTSPIVTDTADFPAIAVELEANNGALSDKTRFNLSRKAFSHTAQYDGMISNYLTSLSDDVLSGQPQIGEFPSQFNQSWIKVQDMRYGENPHQRAAFYRDIYPAAGSLSAYKQLQGKELSYNNIADAEPHGKPSNPLTRRPA